ncbi:hypothetical protein [Legionella bononiensis]|uniref:Uncharacterized protein n=1 Tax=Legionella bononiensis TaxID=2793102 RepID=A0ABS1W6V3_9GAMM|nr:hypothetical protein [Legionella bononiensis]MBL7525094.1 hypothetical protein [Legionella bononiensis]MBL7562819.1 hypothetical protein [Legionella bononiensis]
MKQSEIREAHAQHGTFLIGARFAGLPGLRASHSIRATFDFDGYGKCHPDSNARKLQIIFFHQYRKTTSIIFYIGR